MTLGAKHCGLLTQATSRTFGTCDDTGETCPRHGRQDIAFLRARLIELHQQRTLAKQELAPGRAQAVTERISALLVRLRRVEQGETP
jgi:hypothetical protein